METMEVIQATLVYWVPGKETRGGVKYDFVKLSGFLGADKRGVRFLLVDKEVGTCPWREGHSHSLRKIVNTLLCLAEGDKELAVMPLAVVFLHALEEEEERIVEWVAERVAVEFPEVAFVVGGRYVEPYECPVEMRACA